MLWYDVLCYVMCCVCNVAVVWVVWLIMSYCVCLLCLGGGWFVSLCVVVGLCVGLLDCMVCGIV